ncbi:MAG: DUF5666 domain-containing protein [Anaerolineae bacterium]
MKTRMFTLLAVLTVLAVLVSQLPAPSALAATPHEFRFQGKVQSMPAGLIGDWKVSGRTVHVSAQTQVDQTDGLAKNGASVRVEGFRQTDGSINATSIDILTPSISPH